MSKRLSEKQIAAIEYLALPQRGGMTYEEIANKVGVTRATLSNWRKDERFNEARRKRVMQMTQEHLPDVMDAAIKGITEDRNAAIFRTYLQALGMLTEKVEIDDGKGSVDTDAMRAEIEKFRKGNVSNTEE